MRIRPLRREELADYLALRVQLWPEGGDEAEEVEALLRDPQAMAFVAEAEGRLVGFVEVSLRPYAEGCETRPVGYLEGWYVLPSWRRRGVGRALVEAAEAWARAKGCREMASDAALANLLGQEAHRHLGYEEVERIVCFRKPL
ncbi:MULTISPECIES: aminoglycoside 6'-N-acetyltransferase [Thermus]|uniref:Aminoglycoside N(6')-acetyltransferase type 1 n=1 Tax=Thermus brockianus TaxID=56956 RepID=A0A1J0LTJ7_THEBO|nr:aminoglycoside 6'-N-acetyltransferase [Thermus brockianus]APD08781.1 Aminoglycoside N(6')-acetyltransferase type 1 [Thermus brockianus]BDG15852.1 cryptic aminoglycoside N-acetyltransferase AAC(6')-Iy/Iaa [Thermus brockianus]